MMRILIGVVVICSLSGCFAWERKAIRKALGAELVGPPKDPTQTSSYVEDAGGLHKPTAFVDKAKPVVPPAGKQEETPKAKPESNCAALCGTLVSINNECASLTTSCMRYIKPGVDASTIGICQTRDRECAKADRALEAIGRCICSNYE